jgi:hypothetical protein
MHNVSFEIEKKEYRFKDITLARYYELQAILGSPDEDSRFEIASILTDCPVEDLKSLKYHEWDLIWETTNAVITSMSSTTESIQPIIEFKGVEYGLPAIEDLTVGEFADLDIIMASQNPEKRMAEIAAILYRPIQSREGEDIVLEKYDTAGFKKRAKAFEHLPLTAIRSANAFFLRCAMLSLGNTRDSLLKTLKTNSMFPSDLDSPADLQLQEFGGESLTSLLEKILLSLEMPQVYPSDKVLTGSLGEKTKSKSRIWPFKHKQNTH